MYMTMLVIATVRKGPGEGGGRREGRRVPYHVRCIAIDITRPELGRGLVRTMYSRDKGRSKAIRCSKQHRVHRCISATVPPEIVGLPQRPIQLFHSSGLSGRVGMACTRARSGTRVIKKRLSIALLCLVYGNGEELVRPGRYRAARATLLNIKSLIRTLVHITERSL
ncbi:hypothetical protein OE88DRAFT_1042547 [Heliocybe sulcata]|uniref:Uncharacterized protein n=1 Tax=Heliocybe sulcata TaxID=5364 RepID=A0A5C3MLA8_9AGAM|nr:hypothetical protein OE88DRAFT_1042547 [Heliocybe sulcata]